MILGWKEVCLLIRIIQQGIREMERASRSHLYFDGGTTVRLFPTRGAR